MAKKTSPLKATLARSSLLSPSSTNLCNFPIRSVNQATWSLGLTGCLSSFFSSFTLKARTRSSAPYLDLRVSKAVLASLIDSGIICNGWPERLSLILKTWSTDGTLLVLRARIIFSSHRK